MNRPSTGMFTTGGKTAGATSELLQFVDQGSEAFFTIEVDQALLFGRRREHAQEGRVDEVLAIGYPYLAIGEFDLANKACHTLHGHGFAVMGELERRILQHAAGPAGRK